MLNQQHVRATETNENETGNPTSCNLRSMRNIQWEIPSRGSIKEKGTSIKSGLDDTYIINEINCGHEQNLAYSLPRIFLSLRLEAFMGCS